MIISSYHKGTSTVPNMVVFVHRHGQHIFIQKIKARGLKFSFPTLLDFLRELLLRSSTATATKTSPSLKYNFALSEINLPPRLRLTVLAKSVF